MEKNYKEFISSKNQKHMRMRLFAIIKKKPKPLHLIAEAIGISKVTLFRFLKDERSVDFVRLSKIESWIKDNE